MKLYNPNLLSGENSINSLTEYLEMRNFLETFTSQRDALRIKITEQEDEGQDVDELYEKLNRLLSEKDQVMYEFFKRKPYVLVSRCPYCEALVWQQVGIFSLTDEFWCNESGYGQEYVLEESCCPHLFCVDGALNLNGHQPAEAHSPSTVVTNDKIWMAAEVPFVKPRVLNLSTMVAVIHSLPIAEKYTAYPIVYFAEQQPGQGEFCIGWARTEYLERDKESEGRAMIIAKRSDAQDYELENWVRQGKLFWLDFKDEEYYLVRGPGEEFPYGNIVGRRHPYTIKYGHVYNLRNRTKDSRPQVRMEW